MLITRNGQSPTIHPSTLVASSVYPSWTVLAQYGRVNAAHPGAPSSFRSIPSNARANHLESVHFEREN
jgi:hypothetical protein